MTPVDPQHPTLTASYLERASLPRTSPVAAYLLRLIAIKKTNLCVSADVSTTRELLQIAEDVGDSICCLKTHADIINDFGPRTIEGLKEIAIRKHFLVFEDRKFGDIGSTVQKQFTAGPLQIVRWANIINAHIFPGPAIIKALSEAADGAVAKLNTAVTTSISASPVPSYLDDSDDIDSPVMSGHEEEEEEPENEASDEEEHDAMVEGQLSPCVDEFSGRKPSVVSVSTTISTMTESISPQPTPRHEVPPHSTEHGHDAAASDPTAAALRRLGEPPFLRSLLLLAEMSSAGNLMTGEYTQQCVVEARHYSEFVMGFIAQRSLNELEGDNFVTMTPGVQIGSSGDGLGQRYNTPEKVIQEAGTDVIIVGRGIIAAHDRHAKAEEYRQRGWEAYEARLREGVKAA